MGAHYPGNAGRRPNPPLGAVRLAVGTLALPLLLAACGGDQRVRDAAPAARHWGSAAPSDPAAANAVLMRVFRDMLELRLPRTSRALAGYQGPRIAPERLAPSDLVFFGSGGEVSHVGIYVGDGRFVHAPSTGGTVRLDRLDGAYWRDHYSGALRVLGSRM